VKLVIVPASVTLKVFWLIVMVQAPGPPEK
jgi:hypothetical protein